MNEKIEKPESFKVVCPHCGQVIGEVELYPAQVSHWQGEWCCGSKDCYLDPSECI